VRARQPSHRRPEAVRQSEPEQNEVWMKPRSGLPWGIYLANSMATDISHQVIIRNGFFSSQDKILDNLSVNPAQHRRHECGARTDRTTPRRESRHDRCGTPASDPRTTLL
jgi:hypothetical protein